MKSFEIHITGDEGIIEELNNMMIKNITVELLKPDEEVLRTEFMSSFIMKFYTFTHCADYVNNLLDQFKSKIIRVKIECPYYDGYVSMSLYMESHFIPSSVEFDITNYPLSRNKRSGKVMGTDREYSISRYDDFIKKWEKHEIELCLFDTFIEEDKDWFDLYKK